MEGERKRGMGGKPSFVTGIPCFNIENITSTIEYIQLTHPHTHTHTHLDNIFFSFFKFFFSSLQVIFYSINFCLPFSTNFLLLWLRIFFFYPQLFPCIKHFL